MKGFKAFNQDFTCTPKDGIKFQYKVGTTYTHDGTIELCKQGFHFVENPLDAIGYYPPSAGRYTNVEADGVSTETESDSKRVATTLHIGAELSLIAICGLGVKFILDKVDFTKAPATNTGDRSAATNTGYRSAATNTGYRSAATNTGSRSAATNTGDRSAATNTGDRSAATNTGSEGCAISLGIEGKARGAVGCWLTLAEWNLDKQGEWHRVDVQTKKVDGKKIKADQFYVLTCGTFTEVD